MSKKLTIPNAPELLEKQRIEYINGDHEALFKALYYCAMFDLVMPEWVAIGYLQGHRKYFHHKEEDLGKAFGVEREKNYRQGAQRKKHQRMLLIYHEIFFMHRNDGATIGKKLFDKVGKNYGISGSTVRDYYYEAEKTHPINFDSPPFDITDPSWSSLIID